MMTKQQQIILAYKSYTIVKNKNCPQIFFMPVKYDKDHQYVYKKYENNVHGFRYNNLFEIYLLIYYFQVSLPFL